MKYYKEILPEGDIGDNMMATHCILAAHAVATNAMVNFFR